MLKYIIASWIGIGTVTYGQCMGQYHAKWPSSVWTDYTWVIRRTCIMQGVIPITGLPMVLWRGSTGENNQYNNWQWWPFRWA